MMYFDPLYLVFIGPAVLLALWAQFRVRATYAAARQVAAPLSGAAAARHILDSAGLQDVAIEQVAGELSDHYDPRYKVLRLSSDVYQTRSMAAVGIAAHEAGHALQHAVAYAPLMVRNVAVPAANFGSGVGFLFIMIGIMLHMASLLYLGLFFFSAVVVFQLVNLPVEFDASRRAKAQLASLGIVSADEMGYVRAVLNAAAWTYVAATLQAIMTLLYYLWRANSASRD